MTSNKSMGRNLCYFCMCFQTCMVFLMCFVDVFALINNMTFANIIFDFLTVLGMIYYRIKKPEIKRPFKVSNTRLF